MEFIITKNINNELKNDWNYIEADNSITSPFQNLNWIESYINSYNKFKKFEKTKKEFYFFYVKKDNKILIIIPLQITYSFIKTLQFLGGPFNDINIPIINSRYKFEPNEISKIQKKLLNIFKKKVDLVFFRNQPDFFYNNIRNYLIFKKIFFKEKNYFITKNENYLDNLKKEKFWKDLERRKKRYLEIDNYIFKIVKSRGEKQLALNFFLKTKFHQMEKAYKNNYLRSKSHKNFVKKFFLKNHVFILMNKHEKILACASCILHNNVLFYVFPAYNPAYSNFAAGQQLLKHIIIQNEVNFNKLDFTIGEERYKKYWSNDEQLLTNSIYANNFKGYIYIFFIKLKNKLKNTGFYNYFVKMIRKFK